MQASQRWSLAQDYEKAHWVELARRIVDGREDLAWYRWRARKTQERLAECGIPLDPGATVAEVGSGPVGQVGFLQCARRYAFDPLMGFYEQNRSLLQERPANVAYVEARGESLPLDHGSCDLVIIDNCIDHCEDPGLVLSECRRILRGGGRLYLTVNVRSRIGRRLRNAIEAIIPVDRGHPHNYDRAGIRRLVLGAGFEEIHLWHEGFGASIATNWHDSRFRTVLKIGTLTLERVFEGVWRSGERR